MVVCQRQINGLIKTDPRRSLPTTAPTSRKNIAAGANVRRKTREYLERIRVEIKVY
jgi:hypothetical protein